ncbi:hypothetical protein INH39_02755 [Massilia violaceinigra]|uniref:YkuD domain-containing protein n=1 Tax=Massilia violaceinigra TaxID=2045208 RepID=A0ABY4A7F2_9BURK|nr:hypothetical protein [Massilia violaceinigra]UOD30685.1 hypothetical protein INH39_02755 [Massilia violaceinigra]
MKFKILFRCGIFAVFTYLSVGCELKIQKINVNEGVSGNHSVAKRMFEQRCLKSGEKIYKKIENVDGIFLLKLRSEKLNFSDQYALDDPYGSDFTGEGYIESFLRGFYENNYRRPDHPIAGTPMHLGYQYVEAIDVKDAKRYRYVGIVEQPGLTDPAYFKDYRRFVSKRVVSKGPPPRYGVIYEDISTKEERDYWIAGSSLKVVDIETNEVLAERVGYMYDPGQGNSSGGRAPWMIAASHSCPSFGAQHGSASQALQAETFVGKVLKPSI